MERKAAGAAVMPLDQRHVFPGLDRAAARAAAGGLDDGGGIAIAMVRQSRAPPLWFQRYAATSRPARRCAESKAERPANPAACRPG